QLTCGNPCRLGFRFPVNSSLPAATISVPGGPNCMFIHEWEDSMPRPWDKVISQRPPVLEAARSWYDKWIRGERHGAGNGADLHDKPQAEAPGEKAVQDDTPLEAYAESLKTDTVAEEVEQS